ncbi:GntR family transcriptional regulator [Sporosarcina sp. P12(2017)]|uniref:GntR family transcriptional regulator n=1 Tax=unclassified Sporosarcina TaxID=2647733 RepID=UPI000C1670B7|nr:MULTISPECIES: GntR family transcriptional regulator [unclassified Sporosarcina]PIC58006.1 GntR family transcriptional regulator [Sporosarcina sp. P10]PIC61389.1 GntR family transcriptional regulator [Sporosarcina sp. P12(2017)]
MSKSLDDKKPIYLQIKERIEDQIINNQLQEHDQIPSTNQLVQFYKINHITVSKGINLLVEEEIIYKKRGVGMFVMEGAEEKLILKRREGFAEEFVLPMLKEAKKLKLVDHDIVKIMEKLKGSVKDD